MELDLFLVGNRVKVMQHVDGRRHQAASIDVVLELASEAVTGGSLAHFIKQLAIPTVISMLVTGIYNTADTYFVGRIPDIAIQATAAVGIVFPVMAIIQAFGFLFGHGSGNFLSRMLVT